MFRTLTLGLLLSAALVSLATARQVAPDPDRLALARQIVALSPKAPDPPRPTAEGGDFTGPRSLVMMVSAFSATDFEIDLDQFDRSYEKARSARVKAIDERMAQYYANSLSAEDLRAVVTFAQSPEGRAERAAREAYLRRLAEEPRIAPYQSTAAALAFENTPSGRAFVAAVAGFDPNVAADDVSLLIEDTKIDYCSRRACGDLQNELFKRLGVMLSPGRSNGERATWGDTAGDLFSDPKVADLARAACDGRSDAVAAAIQAGVDPNAKGGEATVRNVENEQMTPLLWAIDCGSLSGIESLLKAGADPNLKVSTGDTPTTAAVQSSNPKVLILLLKYGGNPNAVADSDTTLILAIQKAMELEADGADPETAWTNWRTLLAAGADINAVTAEGQTVIENAAIFGRFNKVLELMKLGAKYDPVLLGAYVQDDGEAPSNADSGRDKVKEILVAKGVKFPVPALVDLKKDDNGYYIQP